MYKIIEKTKIWFSISLILIAVGLVLICTKGLNFGIDFKGGIKLVVDFKDEFNKGEVDEVVKKYSKEAITKTVDKTQYEMKATKLDENQTNDLFNELKEKYELEDSAIVSQELIGASVGRDLTKNAIIAVLVSCVMMLIYIAIRFKYTFGIAALVGLAHDVLITLTVYAIFGISINTSFIAAILTIVGYSINDTIVVFDRIRENIKSMRRSSTTEIANLSIKQTLSRSINTSLTTLIVIGAVNVFVPTIREFSFPLLVGIATGACSSIFIATPMWVILENLKQKKSAKNS